MAALRDVATSNSVGIDGLVTAFREAARERYRNIVVRYPDLKRFLNGWLARGRARQMIGWPKIVASLATAAGLAASAWLIQDRFHQKALADAAERCDVAAFTDKPLDDCLPAVKLKVGAAQQAAVCDASLMPAANARFAALNSCGPGVKRLVAAQDALAVERDTLSQLLEHAQADASAATARAESRATSQQKRMTDALAALAAAPRGGRIVCDADCLRQLAQ
jgi:hypothetical protein